MQFAAVGRVESRAPAAIVQVDIVDELARRLFPGRRPGDAAGKQPRFVEVQMWETGDLLGEFITGQRQTAFSIPEQAVADHDAIVEPASFRAPRVEALPSVGSAAELRPFTFEKEVAACHRLD